MNKRYYSYNRIHPLAHQYSFGSAFQQQWQAPDWNKVNMGGLANAAVGVVGNVINPDGNTNKVGNFLSGAGDVVSMINPLWGAAVKGVGMLTNAAFGSNVNTEAVNGLRSDLLSARDSVGNSLTWDTLVDNVQDLGSIDVEGADLGSQGWFSHAVDKERNKLRAEEEQAQGALSYATNNINTLQNRQAMGTLLADGGSIDIKPSKRGTFKALATRKGMSMGALSKDIQAHPDNYSAAARKKEVFYRNFAHRQDEGGPIFKTDYDMGLTFVNAGGTHEQNPYGGVFMGMAPDGQPNQVEEGEVIFNDYVYSNRLKVPKAVRNKYKLRENKEISFADAIEEYIRKNGIEERNNDPIANRGLEAFASELAMEQEMVKAKKEMRKLQNSFKGGGPLLTGYPNRNPKNLSERLANMVGTARALAMTEAQIDSLETDRRQKENLMSILGEDRSEWWKLSPTWNTPFWNAERRKPGTFLNPPTVDRTPVPNVKRLQEGLDLILQKTAEGREEARQSSYSGEGQEELNQRRAFGGHLFSGEQDSSSRMTRLGTGKGSRNERWQTYALPWIQEYFNDALNRFNNTQSLEEKAAIRQEFMDTVNNMQRGYAGIYNQFGRETGSPNEAVRAYQSNWDRIGGNSRFGNIGSSINYNYGTHGSDSAARGFKADGLAGPITETRFFGDSLADPETMAGLNQIANAMNLNWGATLDYGDAGNKLYMLSAPENAPAPVTPAPVGAPAGAPSSEPEVAPTQPQQPAGPAATTANPEEEESTYDPTYWWRMAGLGANAAGLMYNIFDPYHPQVVNEARYSTINPKYLGDYMEYRPYDINYATSQQDANNAATRNALMQSSAPIRNASLLANDFNNNATRGATRRQALEYNDSLRKAVADFNRGTNQFNAQMYVDAATKNQAARQAYYQDRLRQAQFNSQLDFQHKMMRDQAIGQGLTAIGDYLNDMGKENIARAGAEVYTSTMPTKNTEAEEYTKLISPRKTKTRRSR